MAPLERPRLVKEAEAEVEDVIIELVVMFGRRLVMRNINARPTIIAQMFESLNKIVKEWDEQATDQPSSLAFIWYTKLSHSDFVHTLNGRKGFE